MQVFTCSPPLLPHSAGRREGWEAPHGALLISYSYLPGEALKTLRGRSLVRRSGTFRKKSGTREELGMFQRQHLLVQKSSGQIIRAGGRREKF